MKLLLLSFFMISLTFAKPAIIQEDIVLVRITQEDLNVLGAWRLNRKWLAQALEKTSDAKFVLINLAFKDADIIHPESDRYFLNTLNANENAFILDHTNSDNDSIKVLSYYSLSHKKTMTPLDNDYYEISNRKIRLLSKNHPLFENFKFSESSFIKEYPYQTIDSTQTLSLLALLNGDQDFENKSVFIEVDVTGITSYISEISTEPITALELFLGIYQADLKSIYNYVIPYWIFIILLVFNLSVIVAKNKKVTKIVILINLLIPIILLVLNFHIPLHTSIYFIFPFVWYFTYQKIRMKEVQVSSPDQSREISNLEVENKKLKEKLTFLDAEENEEIIQEGKFEIAGMIAHSSSPLKKLLKKAELIAASNINVLIHGESGTGKEKLAQYIHECSDRKSNPFVAVNCGALAETLIESELFGHEAGAFTGANKQKAGRFEVAHNGILFLDEIGETSPSFQVKLLRVLQEGVFERVGGSKSIKVNVRVIAATHQDLHKKIEDKSFREDLYYRLSGMLMQLPPLRDRKMDIPVLMQHFLDDKKEETVRLTSEIIEWAKGQLWEGNIRQLLTSMERATLNAKMKNRKKFLPSDFELQNALSMSHKIKDKDELADKILDNLRSDKFQHNSVSTVANLMGLHRATISEYFRSWVIRFLIQCNFDRNKIYVHLLNDNKLEIKDSFKKKVDKYIDTVEEKIQTGLKMKISKKELIKKQFKNIPNSFVNDLEQLIDVIQKK